MNNLDKEILIEVLQNIKLSIESGDTSRIDNVIINLERSKEEIDPYVSKLEPMIKGVYRDQDLKKNLSNNTQVERSNHNETGRKWKSNIILGMCFTLLLIEIVSLTMY